MKRFWSVIRGGAVSSPRHRRSFVDRVQFQHLRLLVMIDARHRVPQAMHGIAFPLPCKGIVHSFRPLRPMPFLQRGQDAHTIVRLGRIGMQRWPAANNRRCFTSKRGFRCRLPAVPTFSSLNGERPSVASFSWEAFCRASASPVSVSTKQEAERQSADYLKSPPIRPPSFTLHFVFDQPIQSQPRNALRLLSPATSNCHSTANVHGS